ncbi:C-factor-like isoform X3 [Crassostrea angulata]|uniref:C-factor-like isoform X3 n=1 Tax=Magallana angulata TaxID=2784310 RepID=UPI0022B0EE00|nr:C-factor-like isoform X3 [Crassostrea angulata]
MLPPRSVLITGASRGLGLEFVKQFLQVPTPPEFLFATCRNPDNAKELQEVAKSNSSITIMKLDVSEMNTIEEAKKLVESKVGDGGLNLLINNAGINKRVTLDTVTPDMMLDTFNINVNGPLFTTKTALNMLCKILHNELKAKGIHVGCLHPGWVQTDMGTAKAPVTVSQSVCGCIQVMSNMNAENACVFTDYTGNSLPW